MEKAVNINPKIVWSYLPRIHSEMVRDEAWSSLCLHVHHQANQVLKNHRLWSDSKRQANKQQCDVVVVIKTMIYFMYSNIKLLSISEIELFTVHTTLCFFLDYEH